MKRDEVRKNNKNKIVLIILVILVIFSNVILIPILIKHYKTKQSNDKIVNEISKTQKSIKDIDKEYITNSKKLNNKKSELKDKIKEYNIWLEMKEKLK